jgi:hypothetical protein
MKNLLLKFPVFALAVLFLSACEKDEVKIFFLGGKSPVLGSNKTNVVLTPATESNEAITFNWTNPDYQFTTGISSHDVRYEIEMDINPSFNSSNKRVFNSDMVKRLSKTFTVGELNNFLGNTMSLPLDQNVKVYVRILSYIADQQNQVRTGVLYSNAVSFDTKPYSPPPAVQPPANNTLYLIGNATSTARGYPSTEPDGGWTNSGAIPTAVTFQRVGTTHVYELTVRLDGGKSCLFLPVWGSWDVKYGYAGSNNTNNPTGDLLRMGGGDVIVPAASGNYKITVNFQNGTFTITPA